ncbi:MAG TPA: carbonic anhydrase family protein, partial [Rhodospirillales bacterium]|nr:carbonic anhydrase family protein [Rhodospirillales bacterium]
MRLRTVEYLAGSLLVCAVLMGSNQVSASELRDGDASPAKKEDASPAKKEHGGELPHWSYEGDEGPEKWGDLSPAYLVCGVGVQQSPIDLKDGIGADVGKIRINYRSTSLNVINNGHTIQVNVDPGSYITLDGKRFNLLQYHFHHKSEHLVSGKAYELEVHFVHAANDGALAVLGVLAKRGAKNNALAPVWSIMPRAKGEASGGVVSPINLLPNNKSFFRYRGSLTTPPCSQKVIWTMFRTPVEMSGAQIDRFSSIFPNNARPV